jgi:hypothetical protein
LEQERERRKIHHGVAEDAEDAQSIQIASESLRLLCALCVSVVSQFLVTLIRSVDINAHGGQLLLIEEFHPAPSMKSLNLMRVI